MLLVPIQLLLRASIFRVETTLNSWFIEVIWIKQACSKMKSLLFFCRKYWRELVTRLMWQPVRENMVVHLQSGMVLSQEQVMK